MKLSFQWLTEDNLDKMVKYYKTIFKNSKWEKEEEDNFRACLDGKLNGLYDKVSSCIIKLDGKDVGITGFYSSNLFKTDMWIGWTGFLDKNIESRFSESVLKCLEGFIKTKFSNITHIRVYIKTTSIGTQEIYENIGYIREDKAYKRQGVAVVVMSKCIKGKFKHWVKKPIW